MIDTYVCIDLETTGLHLRQNRIIEIGAVKVVEGRIVDRYTTFVNPARKLEERIVELTGIRDQDLEDAPEMDQVFPQIMKFLEDLPLLGHRVMFDYSFLKKEAENRRVPFEKEGIDTLKIAQKYLPALEHRSLDYLCEYYGIPHQAHRALADAEATSILYHKLAEQFYGEEEELFRPKPLVLFVKRDNPPTKGEKERLYRLLEQHKITLGADVEKLTRSEVSRLIDKIFAKYGR